MSDPFIGEIRIFAGNFAPRDWALCDGQTLPISQYTTLFSILGNTYGGDGRSTFMLPNLKGRAPMHPGRGPGLTQRRLGEHLGSETMTLNESQIPSHTHTMQATMAPTGSGSPDNASLTRTTAPLYQSAANNLQGMAPEALASAGGGQAHNNMQPYLALNFIIALNGTYPSRS